MVTYIYIPVGTHISLSLTTTRNTTPHNTTPQYNVVPGADGRMAGKFMPRTSTAQSASQTLFCFASQARGPTHLGRGGPCSDHNQCTYSGNKVESQTQSSRLKHAAMGRLRNPSRTRGWQGVRRHHMRH